MKTMAWMSSILLGLALALACLGAEEPLFEGLGSYTRPITTDSPEAQKYFNHVWVLGTEAGFDRDGYRTVLEQVFK